MDESKSECLRLIYTRIGMMMEDASIVALALGAPSSDFDPKKIAELEKSVEATATLISAARLITE